MAEAREKIVCSTPGCTKEAYEDWKEDSPRATCNRCYTIEVCNQTPGFKSPVVPVMCSTPGCTDEAFEEWEDYCPRPVCGRCHEINFCKQIPGFKSPV